MKTQSQVGKPEVVIVAEAADATVGAPSSDDDRQYVSADRFDSHISQPVVLNTPLHQLLLQTSGVKASTLASAKRALKELRRRRAEESCINQAPKDRNDV